MMVKFEKIKPEIMQRLQPLNPDKVILFGSYAHGTPGEESDIKEDSFQTLSRAA